MFNRPKKSSRNAQGDVCQLGTNSAQVTHGKPTKGQSAKAKNTVNPWARLFGKRGKQPSAQTPVKPIGSTQIEPASRLDMRRFSSMHSTRSELRQSDLRQSDLRQSDLRPSDLKQSGSQNSRLTPKPSPSFGQNSSSRSRLTDRQRDSSRPDSPVPPYRSGSLLPFSQKDGRSEIGSRNRRFSRSPETRLQSADPTRLQQQTSLQDTTVLQNRHSTDGANQRQRSRRRRTEGSGPARPRSRSVAISLYIARMLILSIGIGVLAGTVLSAWNPASSPFLAASNQGIKQASSGFGAPMPANSGPSQLQLAQEITPLKAKIETLSQQYSGFTPGLFLVDLDSNNYLDLGGANSFAAASTIKVPILVAFFQDVDAGKIRLDEKLTLSKEVIAQGSGDMQYLQPGSQFTVLETATKMITISDNTATNMLITRLGGLSALNQRFSSWGLTATTLNSILPDLPGTNTTSPKELTSLMVRVSQGDLVSLRSRDRILDIMRRTVNNSQLPQGLGEGATIAHKTGDIGTLIGDVGLIDMPNGKRYAVTVLVKRTFNDDRAYDLIQKVSRTIYQHLSGSTTVSGAVPTVSPSSASGHQSSSQTEQDAETNTEAQHTPGYSPLTPERATQPNPIQASTQ